MLSRCLRKGGDRDRQQRQLPVVSRQLPVKASCPLSAGSCQEDQSRVTSQELPLSILIRLDCSHCCDYAFSGHASLLQDHRSLARWLRQRCRQKMQWFDLLVP
jgi:hypothetical protein